MGADDEVGASDAEGATEPVEEVVVEASGDGTVDAVEEASEARSGEASADGAVDEVGSPADAREPPGSCEGAVVSSAAENVDGLAGLLIPEARSMLIRSPQSRVLVLIVQLRFCPASSSGTGACQAAWEAEELRLRATRVSRRSAITRRIISCLLTRAVVPLESKEPDVGSWPRLDRSCCALRIGALTNESGSEPRVSAQRPPVPSARTRAMTTPRMIRRPLPRRAGVGGAMGTEPAPEGVVGDGDSGEWDVGEGDSEDGDMGTA